MLKLILFIAVLTVSCVSNGSSITTNQEIVNQSAIPATTQNFPVASPDKTPKIKFDFDTGIGVAETISETELCLIIPINDLSAGDKIAAIFADEPKAQFVLNAVVTKKVNKCGLKNREVFYYSLKVVDGKLKYPISEFHQLNPVAIAFPINSKPVNLKSRVASYDLNGDGQSEQFRACTSSEGSHLTVWSGQPLKSKCQWHWYVGLGFATEPNCTKKDYEE